MKTTTKIYWVVCLTFLLTQFNAFAQYNGGNSSGSTANELSGTSCSIPSHFYAYFGGNNDGAGVDQLSATSCGFSNFQYAYFGGNGDGAGTEELNATACGIPPSFFAYMGGNNDGAGVETIEANACGFPAQFYAYFGGDGDGFTLDKTAPICPTEPPVASFTASTTALCVGQSVTFTDTSTNIPFVWSWTITGATPSTSTDQNPSFVFNTAGTYTVVFTATNYNGSDTATFTDYITVTAVPVINSTTPASRCDTGTVTLQATATLGTLNWYDAPTLGNLVGTGTSFTTPSISATTTYYVESVVGTCTSTRVSVVATVNTTPSITATTPANRCGTGNISLQATASTGTIQWYDLPSGGTLLANGGTLNLFGLSTTTTYYVQVTNGFCTSPRTPVIATINEVPSVTSTTAASRCDAGTVTLQASASSGTLNWYDAPTLGNLVGTGTSFTTPSIASTTTYYVEATSGTCNSPRTAVTATINVTPTITSTTPNSRCDAGTVTLFAATNAGTLQWYDLPSGGTLLGSGTAFTTPSISISTTYYVQSVNGSCTSVRTSVTATVNASPTITSTTPASICSGDSFTISATASEGTLNWYNLPSGGSLLATGSSYSQASLGATATYYVEAVDGSCTSTRTAVEVTVTNRPTVTSVTPASRCGDGSVTLSATFSSGTINWYDAPSGGNLVGTGSNFITPSLSNTTNYYVEATNGSCTSTVRTTVTATIDAIPVITSTIPADRCGAGNISLQATASTGTIQWYDLPSGGTLLASGGTLNLFGLSSTTTYYVQVTNGVCTSPRTPVIATINEVPSVTSTTPASRCDTGTVTLQASASSGTLNWYDAPTLGNLVGTGTSFTTPSIASTTTYYVEATSGTCNSPRTAVTATVNVTPSITSTTPNSRCDAGSVTLFAATNAGTLQWYDVPSGGTLLGTGTAFTTPSISISTTYYVQSVNGSCTSVRTAVTATVNASPTITSTSPTTICSGDSFTISATASAGTLNWYNLPSGGTLLATGSTYSQGSLGSTATYYVEAVDGSCASVRTPVEVTVTNRPTVTSVTPASRCGDGTVTLSATFSSGTINWYDAPVDGNLVGTGSNFTTPSLSATVSYYVEATNGSCTTLVRTAVTATINEIPVLTSTTPASRCGDGSVTLQATASIGTINWYDQPTGGTLVAVGGSFTTPVLGSTTIYYVEVVNGGCNSARTAVNATVFAVATITSTTDASRCDTGTLTLQATSNVGTLNWYDAPTGGNLVGTGTSFTTPTISISTTYYVEATNGDCTSVRVAVTASIAPTSAPSGFANQTFCDGETIELIVVSGSNIVWYDAPTNGNVIPTGTLLVSGTTYYASQTVNGCESELRLAVTMTSGGCLGNEEFVAHVIKLYPNPVIDVVTISSSETMTNIEVVSMLGQIIYSNKVNEMETQVDMDRYAAGTYLIRVSIDDSIQVFKVLKK